MSIDPCNYAFIDGQNLHLGTTTGEQNWHIDFRKLRRYLRDKYNISNAYYFLGYVRDELNPMYTNIQEAGFIVVFKKQMANMKTNKKGNIDTDLVFNVMEKLIDEPEKFEKILLISGDGDFKTLVDYLIKKDKFLKILFPNKEFASSLYYKLGSEYFDYITNIKSHIEYTHKTGVRGDSDKQKKGS